MVDQIYILKDDAHELRAAAAVLRRRSLGRSLIVRTVLFVLTKAAEALEREANLAAPIVP